MSADGTWNVTLQTPLGARTGTLTLRVNGSALSGVWAGPQRSGSFEGGSVEGDGDQTLRWEMPVRAPIGSITIACTAIVRGDEIEGQVKLGPFGGGTLAGKRA
ncbi:MAG: hypothetical protein O2798_04015 [Chloroflexi bacterium]|nr:hypothetical protein [Chloroflexota bacterium]MDA1239990.1 hypothetical protein [Chloroflexota bacterium]